MQHDSIYLLRFFSTLEQVTCNIIFPMLSQVLTSDNNLYSLHDDSKTYSPPSYANHFVL